MKRQTFHPSSMSQKKHKRSVRNYGEWYNELPTAQFKRASVIPISTNAQGQPIVLLGLYTYVQNGIKITEFTDFGGGLKMTDTFKTAALREFREESNNVFDVSLEQVLCGSLYDSNGIAVSKTYFPIVPTECTNMTPMKNNELCGGMWITLDQFFEMIETGIGPFGYRLFGRVQKIMANLNFESPK